LEPFGSAAAASGAPAGRDRGEEFVCALEAASREIRDPVAKLKYIRNSLARYQALDRCVRVVPIAPLRRQIYRWLSLEGLQHVLGSPSLHLTMPPAARRSLVASRLLAASLALGALSSSALALRALIPETPAVVAQTASAAPAPVPRTLPPVAESLAPLPAGITPAAIWLVEKGAGFEQYSNGLRIDTSYAVAGEPRRYRVFRESEGLLPEWQHSVAGLLFHTSESDIWPLLAEFNENLRHSSQSLLRYLKRNRTYHYLIDRFGRVFRVVEEDGKANHAGNSVWSRDGRVFLSLNNAFLGVSFETRWDGGRALPITQAQLATGRSLTDYLRQRYEIPEDMCVTHGLTSVNPKKRLIGHHMDWSRGFPFAAFGLPDQYARVPASVALFGFGYDDDFLAVLGEPWDGVRQAERALEEEARLRGQSVAELRRAKQALYDRWMKEQAQEDAPGVTGRADGTPAGPGSTASGG
jgi:hypothetical protein